MSGNMALDAEIARLTDLFRQAGGQLVDLPVLQPAETLLDLYGEDIRARAYVTTDPLAGEMMLRPDFTVPVVQMHMQGGPTPARYAYAGKVFRIQELDSDRPPEYDQVGFELFDGADPAAADAEVFALFSGALAHMNLRAVIGDIGILLAAVRGLSTPDFRKGALLRHVWRPRRFRALVDRYSGRAAKPAGRAELLAAYTAGKDVLAEAGPLIGLRSQDEIEARLKVLVADADEPPLSAAETDLLDQIVTLRESAPMALECLRDIAVDMPAIAPAVAKVEARLDAMAKLGVDVDALEFEGGYGRTSMEYYDGFVFGLSSMARPDLPPVATGGRYDALTRALGGGDAIPAVGGVVRPSLALLLAEADR
ncbi:ATP phosphoribosyltransferase regulatory subunit [Psychromarinibacter halotolerans]|uniref:Histidine--tRNA ligase n=1 Tax=Psychromarinibacter halotolerans TaxID=1775175 RepID=A0ABV7GZZ7_9RHOB|nr:ATP phosphoribosyltransferase regulatory subunit [Psychromarinibacter halotolerans]MDF0598580.1 ATP phosphoribosyltransferase regulatory subunit [Psychromarinibacter halotolerans]